MKKKKKSAKKNNENSTNLYDVGEKLKFPGNDGTKSESNGSSENENDLKLGRKQKLI